MPTSCLFVYGTLHPDRAPEEIADVVRRFRPVGAGTVVGSLEQGPEYPAVTMGPGHDAIVRGTVFELPDDPGVLERLDGYEGFSPSDQRGSLFVRTVASVTLENGSTLECWIYVHP